jgi:hypothetical protein
MAVSHGQRGGRPAAIRQTITTGSHKKATTGSPRQGAGGFHVSKPNEKEKEKEKENEKENEKERENETFFLSPSFLQREKTVPLGDALRSP